MRQGAGKPLLCGEAGLFTCVPWSQGLSALFLAVPGMLGFELHPELHPA